MSDTVFSARTWRIYFNRHQAAPLVWCVAAQADQSSKVMFEVAVSALGCTAGIVSAYEPDSGPSDDTGRPVAWFEAYGELTVDELGRATIKPWYQP